MDYNDGYDDLWRGTMDEPGPTCPFVPDPPGFIPAQDWTPLGFAAESAKVIQFSSHGRSPDPATVAEPSLEVGLHWHEPRSARDPRDLTPDEAGWDKAWGWFVPFDIEPALPETPPPLPADGYEAIYDWVTERLPDEIKERLRQTGQVTIEGYLAHCMFLGRRPDIYERYDPEYIRDQVREPGATHGTAKEVPPPARSGGHDAPPF